MLCSNFYSQKFDNLIKCCLYQDSWTIEGFFPNIMLDLDVIGNFQLKFNQDYIVNLYHKQYYIPAPRRR